LRQDPGGAAESPAGARTCGNGSHAMRVSVPTFRSCAKVEPLVVLAVLLRALGAELRVCAPPDCAGLAEVGVPMVSFGQSVRPLVHGSRLRSAADEPRRAAELEGAQLDSAAAAARGCVALVAA
jgi:vancomycin aglycone glucosyltransferase